MQRVDPRALIVEQDGQWIRELRRILEDDRFGFHVSVSTSSDDALSQIQNSNFDLVTLDIGLSGESAIAWKTVVTRLKALRPSARVLIVTGNPSVQTAMDAINYYPINGYFSKNSFDMEVFEKKLAEILQGDSVLGRQLRRLDRVAETLRSLGPCLSRFPPTTTADERNMQATVFAILRAQYQDALSEVTLGRTAEKEYRCDIWLEASGVIVELKRIRDHAHTKKIEAELHDDMGGYHITRPGAGVVFLIWDGDNCVADRSRFVRILEEHYADVRVVFAP